MNKDTRAIENGEADRTLGRRARPYRQRISKLNVFRAELVQLYWMGASFRAMRRWLVSRAATRNSRRVVASVSTIHAFLRQLPEIRDA